ncbi:MAG: hypothetical protein DDT29_00898 [Dehalococcoidia bacterium]|nr:hypothetical protein [Bacillota bacterium]
MSYQKKLSLEDIAREVPLLSEEMERVLPTYAASLRRVSEMPVEFERRCRAAWIEVLLERTRQSYQDMLVRCMMVGLVGAMLASATAIVTGQPMMAPGKPSTSTTLLSIAIWPSGEIKPVLTADPPGQVGVIVVTFEEFERTAVKLKNDVQSGELMPSVEDEIPGLIYKNLGKGHRES